jgi:hypothetical protein
MKISSHEKVNAVLQWFNQKQQQHQSLVPCMRSTPTVSWSFWDLKVRSIPPLHGWLDSRITSPSLPWVISTLLGGWQYVKSQITLLTPFNQKCLAKFWKLHTTWFFFQHFLCEGMYSTGSKNYVTHSKSKAKLMAWLYNKLCHKERKIQLDKWCNSSMENIST